MMRVFICKECGEDFPGWEDKDYIHTSKHRFNLWCTDEWLRDPLSREMVMDIDKSEYVGNFCFMNEKFGAVPHERISGGSKGLILLNMDVEGPREYDSGIWGENCLPWIAKLSFVRDFTFVVNHKHVWPWDLKLDAVSWDGTPITTSKQMIRYIWGGESALKNQRRLDYDIEG